MKKLRMFLNGKGGRTTFISIIGLIVLVVFIVLLVMGKIDYAAFGACLSATATFMVTLIGTSAADEKDLK